MINYKPINRAFIPTFQRGGGVWVDNAQAGLANTGELNNILIRPEETGYQRSLNYNQQIAANRQQNFSERQADISNRFQEEQAAIRNQYTKEQLEAQAKRDELAKVQTMMDLNAKYIEPQLNIPINPGDQEKLTELYIKNNVYKQDGTVNITDDPHSITELYKNLSSANKTPLFKEIAANKTKADLIRATLVEKRTKNDQIQLDPKVSAFYDNYSDDITNLSKELIAAESSGGANLDELFNKVNGITFGLNALGKRTQQVTAQGQEYTLASQEFKQQQEARAMQFYKDQATVAQLPETTPQEIEHKKAKMKEVATAYSDLLKKGSLGYDAEGKPLTKDGRIQRIAEGLMLNGMSEAEAWSQASLMEEGHAQRLAAETAAKIEIDNAKSGGKGGGNNDYENKNGTQIKYKDGNPYMIDQANSTVYIEELKQVIQLSSTGFSNAFTHSRQQNGSPYWGDDTYLEIRADGTLVTNSFPIYNVFANEKESLSRSERNDIQNPNKNWTISIPNREKGRALENQELIHTSDGSVIPKREVLQNPNNFADVLAFDFENTNPNEINTAKIPMKSIEQHGGYGADSGVKDYDSWIDLNNGWNGYGEPGEPNYIPPLRNELKILANSLAAVDMGINFTSFSRSPNEKKYLDKKGWSSASEGSAHLDGRAMDASYNPAVWEYMSTMSGAVVGSNGSITIQLPINNTVKTVIAEVHSKGTSNEHIHFRLPGSPSVTLK